MKQHLALQDGQEEDKGITENVDEGAGVADAIILLIFSNFSNLIKWRNMIEKIGIGEYFSFSVFIASISV